MNACPTCGIPFTIQRLEDEQVYVRNVCRCDGHLPCAAKSRCKKAVIQAVLEDDGVTLDHVRCRQHCLGTLDEPIPAHRPRPMAEPVPEPVPEPSTDAEAWALLEAQRAAEPPDKKTTLQCTACQRLHTPAQRPWVRLKAPDGRRTLQSLCPQCQQPGYRATM